MAVLEQFAKSSQALRTLVPQPSKRYSRIVSGVGVSLQFDLVATEGAKTRHFFLNPREVDIDKETARATIEIAHWMLEKAGAKVPIRTIEFVNLHDGSRVFTTTRRKTTIDNTVQNAKIIQTLWPTV